MIVLMTFRKVIKKVVLKGKMMAVMTYWKVIMKGNKGKMMAFMTYWKVIMKGNKGKMMVFMTCWKVIKKVNYVKGTTL